MKKVFVIYPYCFAIYYVLNASTTYPYPSMSALLIAVIILLGFIYLLKFAIGLFVKDNIKISIITLIILVPVLYFPQLIRIFCDCCPAVSRARYILLIVLIFSVASITLILKTKKKLLSFTSYLNLLSICFIFYGAVLVVQHIRTSNNPQPYEKILNSFELKSNIGTQIDVENLPDIYYIILDSYTGSKALKKYFNFSNYDFLSNLKGRGFYIAEESRAVLASTRTSMASTLNMTNDDILLKTDGETLHKLIAHNNVEIFLKSIGYETINLSIFPLSNTPQFYNIFLDPDSLELVKIFKNTIFCILIDHISASNNHKANTRTFSALQGVPSTRQNSPRFIYAHLMTPHEPLMMDRDANIIPVWKRERLGSDSAYIEQVLGTNKLVLEVVDKILLKSKIKPIIIIQGDHGYRHSNHDKSVALSILNAYFLPGKSYEILRPDISPYNSFRIIFNAYFGTSFKILENGID